MIKKIILFLMLAAYTTTPLAKPDRSPDNREDAPTMINNTYVGIGFGNIQSSFSNKQLQNGFQAATFKKNAFGQNVFLGHYFNPHLAMELALIKTSLNNNKRFNASNIIGTAPSQYPFTLSIFALSLRPTWKMTERFEIYGIAGLAMLVRCGFSINNTTALSNSNMASFLTGGGLAYALTSHWHVNAGLEYTTPRNDQQQPGITYAYAGFYYLFQKLQLVKSYTDHYIFHKNLIQLAGFSTKIWDSGINHWLDATHLQSGLSLSYERNIFHTHKYFSFDLGTNVAKYRSVENNTSVQALSVFPAFRLWFFHMNLADFYLKLIVAGPTYISQQYIDTVNLGSHFIFEDQISLGTMIGKHKNFSIAAAITHYSNGGLFPENPGIQVPLMLSMGYAF